MTTSRLTIGFLVSFLVSLFLLRWWQMPLYPLWLYGTLVSIGLLGAVSSVITKKRALQILTYIAVGSIIALLCAQRTVHISSKTDIESFADGTSKKIHGWIAEDPDVRPTTTKLVIAVDTIDGTKATGRVLLNQSGGWPVFRYGNEVIATGKLTKPEIIEDFDYPHYLELRGIRALINRGYVEATESDAVQPSGAKTYRIVGMLYELRKIVEDQIGVMLPEPHASLLAGLLTGSRRGLPQHLSDDFRAAGITHIIAVSGYNITILLSLLGGLLFWLPIKRRFWPLVLLTVAFTLFVGAGPPVVRAAIMGILGLIALQADRLSTPRLTILWTAFFMLLWNPLQLWYDASFQLSFLAVIGITELSNPLKVLLRKIPNTFAIRDSLVATVAAQIGTLPVSILLFHQFSLISPVTNILVAPLVPLAMFVGAGALVLSFLVLPLGLLPAYVAWAILQIILWIGHAGAAVPFAAVFF